MRAELKILLASSFLFNLAAGLFGPIYAVFVEGIGGDLLTAGSAYAVFSIASGVLIFAIGKWEDRSKHKGKLVVASRVLCCFGFLGYIFVANAIQLFLVQLIFGIAAAIGNPAFDSMYSLNVSKSRSASEWGLWESQYAVTIGVAALLGGLTAQFLGFRTLFILMFGISMLSLLVSLLLLRKR
jgi:DHA1 family multidrug resistance protein-like MFS transporter